MDDSTLADTSDGTAYEPQLPVRPTSAVSSRRANAGGLNKLRSTSSRIAKASLMITKQNPEVSAKKKEAEEKQREKLNKKATVKRKEENDRRRAEAMALGQDYDSNIASEPETPRLSLADREGLAQKHSSHENLKMFVRNLLMDHKSDVDMNRFVHAYTAIFQEVYEEVLTSDLVVGSVDVVSYGMVIQHLWKHICQDLRIIASYNQRKVSQLTNDIHDVMHECKMKVRKAEERVRSKQNMIVCLNKSLKLHAMPEQESGVNDDESHLAGLVDKMEGYFCEIESGREMAVDVMGKIDGLFEQSLRKRNLTEDQQRMVKFWSLSQDVKNLLAHFDDTQVDHVMGASQVKDTIQQIFINKIERDSEDKSLGLPFVTFTQSLWDYFVAVHNTWEGACGALVSFLRGIRENLEDPMLWTFGYILKMTPEDVGGKGATVLNTLFLIHESIDELEKGKPMSSRFRDGRVERDNVRGLCRKIFQGWELRKYNTAVTNMEALQYCVDSPAEVDKSTLIQAFLLENHKEVEREYENLYYAFEEEFGMDAVMGLQEFQSFVKKLDPRTVQRKVERAYVRALQITSNFNAVSAKGFAEACQEMGIIVWTSKQNR